MPGVTLRLATFSIVALLNAGLLVAIALTLFEH
jgi:hypothetical protein